MRLVSPLRYEGWCAGAPIPAIQQTSVTYRQGRIRFFAGVACGKNVADLYRVNFEVTNLKPFPYLAFPQMIARKWVQNRLVLMAN